MTGQSEELDPNRPGYVDGWKVLNLPGAGTEYCSLCGNVGDDDEPHEDGCPNIPTDEDIEWLRRDGRIP